MPGKHSPRHAASQEVGKISLRPWIDRTRVSAAKSKHDHQLDDDEPERLSARRPWERRVRFTQKAKGQGG